MSKTIKFIVSGKVQGVFFRASTKKQADSLNIGGWVKNCPNGDVEGMASGTAKALESFSLWLQQGPKFARVNNLLIEQSDDEAFSDFEIR